jgi:hypothetical protein
VFGLRDRNYSIKLCRRDKNISLALMTDRNARAENLGNQQKDRNFYSVQTEFGHLTDLALLGGFVRPYLGYNVIRGTRAPAARSAGERGRDIEIWGCTTCLLPWAILLKIAHLFYQI